MRQIFSSGDAVAASTSKTELKVVTSEEWGSFVMLKWQQMKTKLDVLKIG